jgi:hypothetical protein
VYPDPPQRAKLDHNGERIWKALLVEYDGDDLWYDTAAYAMTGSASREYFVLQWTVSLSHTVRTRIDLANHIAETEVDESAFCLGFWRFYRDTIKMHNILEAARVSIEKQEWYLLSLDTVRFDDNIMIFHSTTLQST